MRRWTLCSRLLLAVALWPMAGQAADRHQLAAWQDQWAQLPAAEQQRLHLAWQQFQQLPVDQQQQLRERFAQLDAAYRAGWRLGPRLGQHWAALQPLFGFVEPSQRDALLQALHGLDDAALLRLARLAQRTPPEGRQALREALLAQPPSQRGSWLQRQVGY